MKTYKEMEREAFVEGRPEAVLLAEISDSSNFDFNGALVAVEEAESQLVSEDFLMPVIKTLQGIVSGKGHIRKEQIKEAIVSLESLQSEVFEETEVARLEMAFVKAVLRKVCE